MTGDVASSGSREISIIGAGSYAQVVAELAESCGFVVTAYFDDAAQKRDTKISGISVNGPIEEGLQGLPGGSAVAVAIGDNVSRVAWLRRAQDMMLSTPILASRNSNVSPSAEIGPGVMIHAGSHVWTKARLGQGTILSPNAVVAHHTTLGEGCFVSTGANVGAGISAGDRVMFGIGSTVSTGVREIGSDALIGAGSVLIRDAVARGVYVGSPARLMKKTAPSD